MSLFIQTANSLVSKVAQWVGVVPSTININATGYSSISGEITTSASATSSLLSGDFIAPSVLGPFTVVLYVTDTVVKVSDPDGVWQGITYPTTILKMPTQSALEVMSCIQLAEMRMRTLELPGLRSDPYSLTNPDILTVDSQGMAEVPPDMNWPILFFQETPPANQAPGSTGLGPWIVYDRVGDREIIRRRMIDQLYVRPFGVPRVIRASFSEVSGRYVFTPNPGEGTTIKAYYQKTFPFLFSGTGNAIAPIVQANAVLNSFPEGYLYGTLWAYYDKNKNGEEAAKWSGRLEEAYGNIEDQNVRDKWSGGDRHLTSEFAPRSYRYSFK